MAENQIDGMRSYRIESWNEEVLWWEFAHAQFKGEAIFLKKNTEESRHSGRGTQETQFESFLDHSLPPTPHEGGSTPSGSHTTHLRQLRWKTELRTPAGTGPRPGKVEGPLETHLVDLQVEVKEDEGRQEQDGGEGGDGGRGRPAAGGRGPFFGGGVWGFGVRLGELKTFNPDRV